MTSLFTSDFTIGGLPVFSTADGTYLVQGTTYSSPENQIILRPLQVSKNKATGQEKIVSSATRMQRASGPVNSVTGLAPTFVTRIVFEFDSTYAMAAETADSHLADLSTNFTPVNLGKVFLGGI